MRGRKFSTFLLTVRMTVLVNCDELLTFIIIPRIATTNLYKNIHMKTPIEVKLTSTNTHKGEVKRNSKQSQEKSIKTAAFSPNTPIITLNVNGPNATLKEQTGRED